MPKQDSRALVIQPAKAKHRVQRILETAGYQVELASSLPSGASLLKANDFSVVILDDSVFGSAEADIPRIAESAQRAMILVACLADDRVLINAVLQHATAEFILKPVDADEICARLNRHARRMRVRAELEDSLHFIRRVADATPELLYLFDVVDGRNIYVNRCVCAMLGCTPDGIPANGPMFFATVMHELDADRVGHQLRRELATAKDSDVIQYECRIKNVGDNWCWIHCREVVFSRTADGAAKQILGTAQDITDRRQIEETRSLLTAIVESSNDAIIGKMLDGAIVSWNAAAERLYGYTAEEAVGHNISILVPPDQPDELPRLLGQISRGEKVDHYATTRVRKGGQAINVSISISPIKNARGDITGASTIAREVSIHSGELSSS